MKFAITPELATVIRTMRARHGVSSKDVAHHLGKSPSFLSKVESGGVRYIDADVLRAMLVFISGDDDFFGPVLREAAELLLGSVSSERLIDQVWLIQYDAIDRPVDVPAGLAAELADGFRALGADAGAVTRHLNANLDSELPPAFPANQIVAVEYEGGHRLIARVEFPEGAVAGVLDGTVTQASYHLIYNLVRALARMQLYPGVATKLPLEDAVVLLRRTADCMDRWGVHSIMRFSHFLSSDEFIEHQFPLVGGDSGVVGRIAEQMGELLAHDSLQAIGSLTAFSRTLEWDPAFALKLIGLPFSELGAMSYANKRKIIEEIGALLRKYDEMDDFERRVESY